MAWCLQPTRRMSIKAFALPLLAAGGAFLVFRAVAARRTSTREAGRSPRVKGAPKERPARAEVVSTRERSGSRQRGLQAETTLPAAFWDAGAESDPDSISDVALAFEPEDTDDRPNLRWVDAQRFEVMQYDDDADDPAEIAADSVSMISEASRTAASMSLADLALNEEAEDERP
jgi:hypothetical protein